MGPQELLDAGGRGREVAEEVDALGRYLFSDEEGREQLRDIDRCVFELRGSRGSRC